MTPRAIRAMIGTLIGLLFLPGLAVAEVTYQFGPAVGPSKPGPQSRWGYTGTSAAKPAGTTTPGKLTDRCRFLRGEYKLRHMFDRRPDSLKGETGCRLWERDHAYHTAIDRSIRRLADAPDPLSVVAALVRLTTIPNE